MYTIEDGVICSKNKIPAMPRVFCDGRLAVKFGNDGVEYIEYYMPVKEHGNKVIFKQGIFDCFRCGIKKDGLLYSPEYKNVRMHPYGFSADWVVNNETFEVGVYVVDQNLYFTMNGNSEYEMRVSFYKCTQYIPAYYGDFGTSNNGFVRCWKEWEDTGEAVCGGFEDRHEDEKLSYQLDVAMVSDCPYKFTEKKHNVRYDFEVRTIGRCYVGILFSVGGMTELLKRSKKHFYELLEEQNNRYRIIAQNAPVLTTKNRAINNFFALAPMFYESLKTRDVRGAIRAKSTCYYVWGWDTMMTNLPRVCWQDYQHMCDILEYFMNCADEEKGLVHACSYDDTPSSYAHLASQAVYVVLLENYVSLTNDTKALDRYYDFGKRVFERIVSEESRIQGLFTSSSISIDMIDCIKETGNDISSFNNSMAYAMTRAMETLAAMKGDFETQARARRIAEDTEKNYFNTFFDVEKGYLVMSVDAETLEQRKVYALCSSYLWDSDYHFELLGLYGKSCKQFLKDNALSRSVLRDVPVWDECYDSDANQMTSTFPNKDGVLLQLARMCGLNNIISQWIKKLGFWMSKITCPEGECYLYETDEPHATRWDGENGIWQAFALRTWYVDILGILLGISVDGGGITISAPYISYELDNLYILGKSYAIKTEGSGRYIAHLVVNGHIVSGTHKIPYDLLKDQNEITICMGKKQPFVISRATGVKITNLKVTDQHISFVGEGYAVKGLFVSGKPTIYKDGKKLETQYLPDMKMSLVKCEFVSQNEHEFRIVRK